MSTSVYSILLAAALGPFALAVPTPDLRSETSAYSKHLVALKPGLKVNDLNSHLSRVGSVSKRGLSDYPGVENVYSGQYNFCGYAGHFDEATIAEIRNNPEVAAEQDSEWKLDFIRDIPPPASAACSKKAKALHVRTRRYATHRNSTWGLCAISHRQQTLSNDYVYNKKAGQGTFAYVLDSGILVTHSEFEGRAEAVFTAFSDGDMIDRSGHGTHVAGTIGGKTFGVSNKARLLGVKVFRGDGGNTSSAVINMSLEGPYSSVFNLAVESDAKSGVITIVSSGNSGVNASDVSPASAPSAITVGAIDQAWRQADYSNYGAVVDILGPGTDTISAGIQSNNDTLNDTGTSMAAPHITGLALNAMSIEGITGVVKVTEYLKKTATKGRITGNLKGSPNLMGNNNILDDM